MRGRSGSTTIIGGIGIGMGHEVGRRLHLPLSFSLSLPFLLPSSNPLFPLFGFYFLVFCLASSCV